MQLVLDTHTHTLVSGHAYSTLREMIEAAKEKGLQLLAVTEHGPQMRGSATEMYYRNFRVVPRQYGALTLMMGMEANITDHHGKLDCSTGDQKRLDYLIASIHLTTLAPGSREENTAAYLGAMENPYVNTIGHVDDGRYPVDMEEVVKKARETHTLLELNNTSLHPQCPRKDAREHDLEMLSLCVEYQVPIVLNSDAHICFDVGNLERAAALVAEVDFPEELIANTSVDYFYRLLEEKRQLFGITK